MRRGNFPIELTWTTMWGIFREPSTIKQARELKKDKDVRIISAIPYDKARITNKRTVNILFDKATSARKLADIITLK